MSFRIRSKDLAARTGTLETKSGVFQTPHMFPVVDPNRPTSTRELLKGMDADAIMTNAYLLKRGQTRPVKLELHDYLGYTKTVATDSGAYQILEFGKVAVTPREIVQYQEEINSDIAVILDVPTGFRTSLQRAKWTVDETIRRADEALESITRKDILWVGPIQGGVHLLEVERSAGEMGKRDFAIYALGSPTELMETQHFDILVDMIVAAKKALPISKPLHLFGAGHPATFPFFVALGCDLFDSAAYALYAKQGKYFTPEGTLKVDEMEELPCNCTTCHGNTANSIRELPPEEKEMLLSRHNLYVCISELRKIREMIRTGRLWEMLEIRSHAHPAFKRCFERLAFHSEFLERYNPAVKLHGIFFYGRSTDARPEIQRYSTKLQMAVEPSAKWLVLLPSGWRRPFHQDPGLDTVVRVLREMEGVSIVFYSLAYGPVPLELDEAYPIPHTDVYDSGSSDDYARSGIKVAEYVKKTGPKQILLVHGTGPLGKHIEMMLRENEFSGKLKIGTLREAVGLLATGTLVTI